MQHAPERSAAFFIDLNRVMAKNPGVILHLKPSILYFDQRDTPEPESQGAPNHPAPETPSHRGLVKRIRTAYASSFLKSSPPESESVLSAGSTFKPSSSDIDEDDDADHDRVHCETVTQAMLLSFLQTISNARGDPAPVLTFHFPSSKFHIPPALRSTLTALRPSHHRIEVVGLNCSTGPVRFTSINDDSLEAGVKTGAYSRKGLGTGTFTTYDKDPGVIFCALEVGRLQLLARSCRQLNSNSANGYPGARGHTHSKPARSSPPCTSGFNTSSTLPRPPKRKLLSTPRPGLSGRCIPFHSALFLYPLLIDQMFLITAEPSKIHFSQATFTHAYLKQMLGYHPKGTEKLEVSPEFNLLIHSQRTETAELVGKILGLLEGEWADFFRKKVEGRRRRK